MRKLSLLWFVVLFFYVDVFCFEYGMDEVMM